MGKDNGTWTFPELSDRSRLIYIKVGRKTGVLSVQWASLVAQRVNNLPAKWETWVQSLGQENPLEKGKAALSSILAWRIPWTKEPDRLQSMGLQRVGHD